jgi:hypothetical protein
MPALGRPCLSPPVLVSVLCRLSHLCSGSVLRNLECEGQRALRRAFEQRAPARASFFACSVATVCSTAPSANRRKAKTMRSWPIRCAHQPPPVLHQPGRLRRRDGLRRDSPVPRRAPSRSTRCPIPPMPTSRASTRAPWRSTTVATTRLCRQPDRVADAPARWRTGPRTRSTRGLTRYRRTSGPDDGGGHADHAMFWEIMGGDGGEPHGDLAAGDSKSPPSSTT